MHLRHRKIGLAFPPAFCRICWTRFNVDRHRRFGICDKYRLPRRRLPALWHSLVFIEDLLFTDMVMPGEMSGSELAEEARYRRPKIKVLFTSGYSSEMNGQLEDLKALGPWLKKPYRMADLARKVLEALKDA